MSPEKLHPPLWLVAVTLLALAVTARLDLPHLLTTGDVHVPSDESFVSFVQWVTKVSDQEHPPLRVTQLYETPTLKTLHTRKESDFYHIWIEEDTTNVKVEVRIYFVFLLHLLVYLKLIN